MVVHAMVLAVGGFGAGLNLVRRSYLGIFFDADHEAMHEPN